MKVSVSQLYTSVACNRTPEIVDWNNGGIICFGASYAVVIYDTNVKGRDPLTVLSHHRSTVNSVKWIRKSDGTCTELVSCSADKTAAIWTLKEGTWKVTATLTGHKEGVTCIYGIYTRNDLVVYTAAIDSVVKVWERCHGVTILKQSINLNTGLCLTLHAHLLPAVNQPLLFCALDDHKIHVFAGEEYHRVHTLVGHEDWVRGMDVLDVGNNAILLASASQDTYIRLWRIQQHSPQKASSEIRVEEKLFHAYGCDWSVKLEAVLAGHEGWVYGVQWHPYVYKDKRQPVFRLLSSSLDKTLIIWEPESSPLKGEGEGAWTERVRVGEVGGNGLGFYGSRFGPNGESFLGHGYNGSFHVWTLFKESGQWEPSVVCGGHFGSVEDVRWGARGELVSVSADQTTRLHAPWARPGGLGSEWHEIARPQVHGYDLSSLAMLPNNCFASSAEEKVVRIFKAPNNFLTNFKNITGVELEVEDSKSPEGASVPSLGLSNKAVFADAEVDDDNDGHFVPVVLHEPPTEETLMQNTLWPESQKLYAHGSEVFALDAAPRGDVLASAARAALVAHAAPVLWDTSNWRQIQKLVSHQLTVTQLAFSPDSQHLLSVSRDRRWTLHRRKEGSNFFETIASTDKTNGVHTRIIWCCAWAHDSSMFATGSRDGKVCVWSKTDTQSSTSLGSYALLGKPLEVNISVTALAFAPVIIDGARIVAVGVESGEIRLYAFDGASWSLIHEMNNSAAHHLAVKRLMFRPSSSRLTLASAAADHFVRIHQIDIS
ncbi:elongator complex protein 2 [Plodia interpunctella]|uniref:elongator complex protein 2 n=1 Tax=Plodia interpunctella TaxID=58824 RepID=UPI00236770DF|nr:elongator complex protein 2 [Plodia interpunctella]